MKINSKEYWERRFLENWENCQGSEQTIFFANIACELLPQDIVKEIKENRYSVCDMGCALGQGVHILSNFFGFNVEGADFSQEAIAIATRRYPQNNFRVLDLRNVSDEVKYDVVFLSNVLEHFENPWEIFNSLTKVASKYIILLVPFEEQMEIDEHLYKFGEENIPLSRSGYNLIYSNAVDASLIQDTYYADNQILLIYKSQNLECSTIYIKDICAKTGLLSDKLDIKNDLLKQLESEKGILESEKEVLESKKKELENEKQTLESEKKELESEIQALNSENEKLRNEKKKLEEYVENLLGTEKKLQRTINILESEKEELNEVIKKEQNEKEQVILARQQETNNLQTEIKELKESFSWRCTKGLRLISTMCGFSELHRKYNERRTVINNLPEQRNIEAEWKEYTDKIRETDTVLLVFSGVKFVENEGQRNIRLVQEAIKTNIKVIYAYWRWSNEEAIDRTFNNKNMFQIPIDVFWNLKEKFFENSLLLNKNKILLVEFPHKLAIDIIDIAKCFGWTTVYDVIDEWEEFSKKGQAIWYDSKTEYRIANQVDLNIATAERLKEKIQKQVLRRTPFFVISNGVNPDRMKPALKYEKYNYSEGDLQIGYFGHLTDAWFDWKLLTDIASEEKNWTFHLIGYGAPENMNLPSNIKLYGKKEPTELPKFAAYWDVAIIPFIDCELTLCVNPIKAYEYLQLGLPIVASNMPELNKFPYAQTALGKNEFKDAIINAKKIKIDRDVVEHFISENTWERKWQSMLKAVESIQRSEL